MAIRPRTFALVHLALALATLGLLGCNSNGHVPTDAEVREAAPTSYRDPMQGNFGNDPFFHRAPGEFAPPAGFQKQYEEERAKRIALERQLAAEQAKKQALQKKTLPKAASQPVQ